VTDGWTDGIAMAYMPYSIYAVVRNKNEDRHLHNNTRDSRPSDTMNSIDNSTHIKP